MQCARHGSRSWGHMRKENGQGVGPPRVTVQTVRDAMEKHSGFGVRMPGLGDPALVIQCDT